MEWQAWVLVSFFALVGFACVLSIPFGLPGTWLLLGFAVLVELADSLVLPADEPTTFGWGLLAVCGGLGLVGEAVEAGAGAAGTRLGGGTNRGMWGAILGGIAGALVFTVALPVPLVGTLIGALVGTFVGAFIGEATGGLPNEASQPRSRRENLRAAFAATIGRLAGTLGKAMVATAIWVLLVWNAIDR